MGQSHLARVSLAKRCVQSFSFLSVSLSPSLLDKCLSLSTSAGPLLFVFSVLVGRWQMVLWTAG